MNTESTSRAEKYFCEYCTKQFFKKHNLNMHRKVHLPKADFKCTFCPYTTNFRDHLVEHSRTHTKERPYKCDHPNCTATFQAPSTLHSHKRTHVNKESDSDLFKCPNCPFKTAHRTSFNRHLKAHSTFVQQFSCDLCPFQTKHKGNLTKHHKVVHLQIRPFKCQEVDCNYATVRQSWLFEHQQNCHVDRKDRVIKPKNFKCPQCPFKFAKKYSLKGHLKTHSDERPFSCDLCPYRARRKEHIGIHKKGVHSTKMVSILKCSEPDCYYTSKLKGDLKRHMKVHEESLVCSFPGCFFEPKRRSHLKMHELVHDGRERPFKCSFCTFASAQSTRLNLHVRSHTGEAPYPCTNCDHRAKSSCNLTKHLRRCKMAKTRDGGRNSC